jgi:uncharacterized protein YqeY
MILRERLNESLKTAMLEKDALAVATLRLILATLKDRDIAERSKGNHNGLSDDEIVALLQSMIKQRRESIQLYERGGRDELARQEAEEIAVIERFLPPQMNDAEVESAVGAVIDEIGAASLKDMGRAMALLRERYAGRMDFAKAGAAAKARLA